VVRFDLDALYCELGIPEASAKTLLQKILDAILPLYCPECEYRIVLAWSPDAGDYHIDPDFETLYVENVGREDMELLQAFAAETGANVIAALCDGYEYAYAMIWYRGGEEE